MNFLNIAFVHLSFLLFLVVMLHMCIHHNDITIHETGKPSTVHSALFAYPSVFICKGKGEEVVEGANRCCSAGGIQATPTGILNRILNQTPRCCHSPHLVLNTSASLHPFFIPPHWCPFSAAPRTHPQVMQRQCP